MERPITIISQGQRMYGNMAVPENAVAGVLMSHGLESNKNGGKWRALSARLYEAGIASLRFSYRGCGEDVERSEGDFEQSTLTSRIADYTSALDFLVGSGLSRLGVIGSSFGGMVALAAADSRMRTLVTLATPCTISGPSQKHGAKVPEYIELGSGQRLLAKSFYQDLGRYDLLRSISSIKCPVFIIHGDKDALVPVNDARKFYDHANDPKRLEIIPGANHQFSEPEHLTIVTRLVLGWMGKHL